MKGKQRGFHQATIAALNESLVLDDVREHPGTSRAGIGLRLGLSPASVSRIVTRLLHHGAVIETVERADGRGRPGGRVTLNHRAGCVLGIDLGGTKCHGVLADLAGTILLEDVRPTQEQGDPLATLRACIDALSAAAPAQLVAAAIGVPALVDPSAGVVREKPNVLWRDFALEGALRDALRVPFVVDNDVKLASLAQAWRGHGRGVHDFATIAIGTGIGGGIVVNGELLRGRNNAAGEIGYLLVRPEQLHEGDPHGIGALERMISGPAIAARAEALLAEARSGAAGSAEDAGRPLVTAEWVFRAAAGGDPVAARVVDEVIETLALALIALTVATDPELIILDGGVGRSLAPYLPRIRGLLARQLPWAPRIETSQLGPNGSVLGAVATALWIDRQARRPELPRSSFPTAEVDRRVG